MRRSVLPTDVKRLVARGFCEPRTALFLELPVSCFHAIPDGKPLRTFPGIACLLLSCNSGRKTAAHFSWNCLSLVFTQFRTENRCALFLELL
ncbi:hypothetical protein FJ967_16165 [Mesorhizobium sp. B2-3-4]|nr:hypothetical protein FJ967_16165 [Mesorhizobium sp. B2-3-4]